jgi:hypothetical protein
MRRARMGVGQLGYESIDEALQWRSAGWLYDEFRQSGVQIGIELAVQLIPARRDQITRIQIWTTLADRYSQLRRQLTISDNQRNSEVICVDMPASLRGSAFNRFAP